MKAFYKKYILEFKRPSGTSRGVMTTKETWFIVLEQHGRLGIGECGILRGLSVDDRPDFEEKLRWACKNIHLGEAALWEALLEFPSIQFGLEMAFLSLASDNPFILFPSAFSRGQDSIPINGLVWMGEEAYMKQQVKEKLQQGFNCIKLKIGAIDFDKELGLLSLIRKSFSANEIEIRLDANGAFTASEALGKLNQFSEYQIHSIEQPIKQGQYDTIAALCRDTPIPIALDEELIGIFGMAEKEALLQKIMPQYIILKPSLTGGFRGAGEWIATAERLGIKWWATSALESNVGLNAIAQWTYIQNNPLPQGLGTGGLFTNNFSSPLEVMSGHLVYDVSANWQPDIFRLLQT